MAQDVGEAEEDGELDAAHLELIDEFLQVDGVIGPFVGMDGDVAELVDVEVAFAPAMDAVHFDGVSNFPRFFHQERYPGPFGNGLLPVVSCGV